MQSHTGQVLPSPQDVTSVEEPGHVPISSARRVIRTCVGCRKTDVTHELVRLVAVRHTNDQAKEFIGVIVDVRRVIAGRGAWIHLDPHCLELAERRRAVGRALRLKGLCDLTDVAVWMKKQDRVGNPPGVGNVVH